MEMVLVIKSEIQQIEKKNSEWYMNYLITIKRDDYEAVFTIKKKVLGTTWKIRRINNLINETDFTRIEFHYEENALRLSQLILNGEITDKIVDNIIKVKYVKIQKKKKKKAIKPVVIQELR
ncbi:MAG: hypothetical protein HUJ68_10305 [Clostridia bacterium]|nr:hypothetical protein [Clostridia bacterium]